MLSTKLEDLAERVAQLESSIIDLWVAVDIKGVGPKCNCHSSTASLPVEKMGKKVFDEVLAHLAAEANLVMARVAEERQECDPVYYTTSRAKLEIKPCPFCGYDKFLVQLHDGRMHVSCNKCSARGPLSNIDNPRDGDAVIAWNKRDVPWSVSPSEVRK